MEQITTVTLPIMYHCNHCGGMFVNSGTFALVYSAEPELGSVLRIMPIANAKECPNAKCSSMAKIYQQSPMT